MSVGNNTLHYKWIPLTSSADLSKIAAEISSEYEPGHIVKRLECGISAAVKGVLIECRYIDKDYRSTYYSFYSKKGQSYRPDCVRLHFFDEKVSFDENKLTLSTPDNALSDHYFGYMVLRPTGMATIGRSVLSPDIRSGAKGAVITTTHKVHLLGYKMMLQGFPSMDQHIDISVCAHAACWSILRHYSERYTIYREFLVHDITMMAQEFNPGGLVPSKGLQVSHAERVFQAAGTFPVHVARTSNTDDSFYRQLHAYVDSGFPLFAAMHERRHAVAVIGYEWNSAITTPKKVMKYAWETVKSLMVVDDNHLPYSSIPAHGRATAAKVPQYTAQNIDAFIVALPEKVHYPADAVEQIIPNLFAWEKLVDLPKKEEAYIRYFITTGSSLRNFMRSRESEFDPRLMTLVMSMPFAQFVWVVEIATATDWASGQISARVVLDATASLREVLPYWLFHGRKTAIIFDRTRVGSGHAGIHQLQLAGMETTALTRMAQNLRSISPK